MLHDIQYIFIVGIKGVAMANLAVILKKMGKHVIGSDSFEHFITDEMLKKNNISVLTSFEGSAIPQNIELVIYAASHGGLNNAQVVEAKKRNIKICHQSHVLSELLLSFDNSIAVCGTHGKTTTAGLLAYCLHKLHAKPSYMIGVSEFSSLKEGSEAANIMPGSDYSHNTHDYFVIEADEYGLNPPFDKTPKFHALNPTYALCTNIDFDHPDVYKDLQDTQQAFRTFFDKYKEGLFICGDDENIQAALPQKKSIQTFGFRKDLDMVISNEFYCEDHSLFDLTYKGNYLGRFELSIFGKKNISNAAGVILCLVNLEFNPEDIRKVLPGFLGAKRRFEKVLYKNDTYLFDDYAHHPTEIEATIQAARSRFPSRRLIIIFQPHTYSRTESLKNEFVDALSKADLCIIAPIFASAREGKGTITSRDLETLAQQKGITSIISTEDKHVLMNRLIDRLKMGDVVFTMGAGDIYKMKDDIIKVFPKNQ